MNPVKARDDVGRRLWVHISIGNRSGLAPCGLQRSQGFGEVNARRGALWAALCNLSWHCPRPPCLRLRTMRPDMHGTIRMRFAVTRHGMVPPYAPLGYQSDMPAFGAVPSEVEIRVVLATGTSSGTSAKIRLEADFCACGCHPRPCPGRNIRPMVSSHIACRLRRAASDGYTNRFIDMGCTFCVMPRSNGGPFSDRWWRGQLSWSGTGGSV